MTDLIEIKPKIQDLINQAVNQNSEQKRHLDFLFRKLEEVKELETLQRLTERDSCSSRYLQAYLLYKSISRANYQLDHLKLTRLENIGKYLEVIEKDLAANELKEPKPKSELTNQQLLILLGERIAKGEIKGNLAYDVDSWLYVADDPNNNEPLQVELSTGKIEPDPVQKFLSKHQLK